MPFNLFRNISGVLRTLGGLKISGTDLADGTVSAAAVDPTSSPTVAGITAGYFVITADGKISSLAGNNAVAGSTQLDISSRTPQIKVTTVRQTAGDAALSTALFDAYAQNNHSSVLMVRIGVFGSVTQGVAPSFSYAYFGQAFNDTIIRFYGNKNVTCDGNLGVGQLTFGTSATKTLALGTGVAPSSSPSDAFQMYSADQAAGNACPHVRTENGGIVKVYQQAAIADAEGGSAEDEVGKINAILGVLRNAGLIAT